MLFFFYYLKVREQIIRKYVSSRGYLMRLNERIFFYNFHFFLSSFLTFPLLYDIFFCELVIVMFCCLICLHKYIEFCKLFDKNRCPTVLES